MNGAAHIPRWPVLPERIDTHDGLALHLRHWPVTDARGTVLIVHGLGEHIGRYAHVAGHFNAWGWSVVGYDQRGHGRSEGARGRVGADDSLLCDLALVIDALRGAQRGPMLLLGHSMGGLVAARFVAGGIGARQPWSREVDALVLSSPALDHGMSAGQKLLLALLGRLTPDLAVNNGLKPEWISRDAQVVRRYIADHLVHDRVTPRLVRFIVDAGALVRERAASWQVPTLLLWAGSDRCVAPGGSAAFAAAAPSAVLSAHEFTPLFHEIFNEPEQQDVFSLLGDWLARLEFAPR
ncbi:MAG TPA: alpha/beta hydrolase [Rubrivivax sp.]|nr:alpha/beta hydrolase [Rubrivivax sp.]